MKENMIVDPISLEVFKNLFSSVADEMGVTLRRTGYSPNIKERLDFSCAIFNVSGDMVAQAAHIPVHLGAMPLSVRQVTKELVLEPGDVAILNDPYRGGSHLPDITMVTPIYLARGQEQQHMGFAANRAHHADVGGMTPGSMPVSRELYQEGLVIPPVKLITGGQINHDVLSMILANVRTPDERAGDLRAQVAANEKGSTRLVDIVEKHGADKVKFFMDALLDYAERITRHLLASLPDGTYTFSDYMDDDGVTDEPAVIRVEIKIQEDEAQVDFTGTALQRAGSINAVYSITLSAVTYVFRALLGSDAPTNSGAMRAIKIIAPEGTLVNALSPAPVAGGNVETSQRIVDVLLGALAQAVPDCVPAASQGTMNNITIGGYDLAGFPFAYYETVGGGMGARPNKDGIDGIHTHMTNTLNTPVEALEYTYPFLVERYQIRHRSGGNGFYQGGNGLKRDLRLLVPAQVTLLTDRRRHPPYGLEGGESGQLGVNVLIRNGIEQELPGKVTLDVQAGDVISVRTPGGGGYGKHSS